MKITEYLQFHDKGAGGVCQGSFSFLLNNNCGLGGDARSLLSNYVPKFYYGTFTTTLTSELPFYKRPIDCCNYRRKQE